MEPFFSLPALFSLSLIFPGFFSLPLLSPLSSLWWTLCLSAVRCVVRVCGRALWCGCGVWCVQNVFGAQFVVLYAENWRV